MAAVPAADLEKEQKDSEMLTLPTVSVRFGRVFGPGRAALHLRGPGAA